MAGTLNSQRNTDRNGIRHPELSTEMIIYILRSSNYTNIVEISQQIADRMEDQLRQNRTLIEQSRQRSILLAAAKRRCDEAVRALEGLTDTIKTMNGVVN